MTLMLGLLLAMNALFLLLCSASILFPPYSTQLWFCSPFYLRYSLIEPWDSLSGYVHPGIAFLASQASDWAGAFWGSLSGLQLATSC